MRSLTFILVASVMGLLSSCSVQKMNEIRCSKCPYKDSVNIKTFFIPKDSMVLVPRDSFSIHFLDSVPCADVEIKGTDSKGNTATLKVKDHKATMICDCAEYKARISWMEKQTETNHTLTRFVPSKKKCNFWLPFILGALAASILWNWKKILAMILKVLKPI